MPSRRCASNSHTGYKATGNDTSSLVESTTNQAVVSKASEWSNVYPPTETISDYRAHQVFANVYYDFRNSSPWTPSVGAGVGMARTNLNYNRRLLRKTIAEGYQDVEPPATIADRPLRAAGTFSMLDATVNGTIIGFQVLAGMDYAIGERTTIGLTAHWTRFGTLKEDVVWSIIRSHAPVRADGVTPFSGELGVRQLRIAVATLGLSTASERRRWPPGGRRQNCYPQHDTGEVTGAVRPKTA